jgi:hypothetical protein
MSFYLPYPDFRRSAKCLTDAHLDEQRLTVRGLIRDIVIHHRESEWSGHVTQLLEVYEAALCEWSRRGLVGVADVVPWMLDHDDPMPSWIGDQTYHGQHRMALLRLNPEHYGRMKWR